MQFSFPIEHGGRQIQADMFHDPPPGQQERQFEEVFLETILMHKEGLPPQLLSWHEKNHPENAASRIKDHYPNMVIGNLSKDGESNFELSLFARI